MKHFLFAVATCSLLALGACGDDMSNETAAPPAANNPASPVPPQTESRTQGEMREAGQAIEDAARASGDAASSAVQDLRDASGPAVERAREGGARALDAARDGLNDLTRGAACQTSRAANDAQGIAANC